MASPISSPLPAACAAGPMAAKTPAPIMAPRPITTASPSPSRRARRLASFTSLRSADELGGQPRSGSVLRGLEDLDQVVGRVLDQDLRSPGARHDLVAERHPGLGQPGDLGLDVV